MHFYRADRESSVLILALWTLFLLAALAVAVGSYVGVGMLLAGSAKSRTATYNLARSGVEYAAAIVAADTNHWDGFAEAWGGKNGHFTDVSLPDGSFSVRYVITAEGGVQATNAGVIDEESKININRAEKPVLAAIIRRAGGVDIGAADTISAAIIDWRDKDDSVSLTGGAENGYYKAQITPYACHNDEFQSLLELKLVKGVTGDVYRKISPFLTVFGDGKVNVNTAGEVVLAALASAAGGEDGPVCGSIARKIVSFRNGGGSFTDASSAGVLAQLRASGGLTGEEEPLLARMMMYVTIRSTCFGGIASGRAQGSAAEGSSIEFVYDRGRNLVCFWREQ